MKRYVVKERTHPETGNKGWGVWDTRLERWVPGIHWQKRKPKAKHYADRANRMEEKNS